MHIARALVLTQPTQAAERPWPSVRGAKHLVPVANKPILFHNLEELRSAGVLEAMIVAEPEVAEPIRAAVGDGKDWGLHVGYLEGPARQGLDEALRAALDFIDGEPVMVESGDMLLSGRIREHMRAFAGEQLDALALRLALPERLAGGYLLSRQAVSALVEGLAPDADPLARIRRRGGHVRVADVDGCRPCHGGQEALLDANRRMLGRIEPRVDEASVSDSRIQGVVDIHPTARVERSTLRGPVIVGAGARIADAYVGPYTSIGDGVLVEGVELEHSIVLEGARLRFAGVRLESSVIGRNARVERRFELPSAMRLTVGDCAEVSLA